MKLTRAVLIDIRTKSLRKRTWFRKLASIERSLVNLTIRVVDEVKSPTLGHILEAIVRKLEDALESSFLRRVWVKGYELASRLARTAYSWGYTKALNWVMDRAYILYLGVSLENASRIHECTP